jgi:hypothetical protein
VQAALSALVRSATKSSRLSESRRSTSEAASGSTAASRSLREAPQGGAVLREGGTLDELACGFVDRDDGDRHLVGIDPY